MASTHQGLLRRPISVDGAQRGVAGRRRLYARAMRYVVAVLGSVLLVLLASAGLFRLGIRFQGWQVVALAVLVAVIGVRLFRRREGHHPRTSSVGGRNGPPETPLQR